MSIFHKHLNAYLIMNRMLSTRCPTKGPRTYLSAKWMLTKCLLVIFRKKIMIL